MSLILFGQFPNQEPTATKEGRFITKDGRVIFIGGPGGGGGRAGKERIPNMVNATLHYFENMPLD